MAPSTWCTPSPMSSRCTIPNQCHGLWMLLSCLALFRIKVFGSEFEKNIEFKCKSTWSLLHWKAETVLTLPIYFYLQCYIKETQIFRRRQRRQVPLSSTKKRLANTTFTNKTTISNCTRFTFFYFKLSYINSAATTYLWSIQLQTRGGEL